MTTIKKTYAYHSPSEEGMDKITMLRTMCSDVHDVLEKHCPESRERSIALTKLEEMAMFAIKAVVVNDPKSEIADCCKANEDCCKETSAEALHMDDCVDCN